MRPVDGESCSDAVPGRSEPVSEGRESESDVHFTVLDRPGPRVSDRPDARRMSRLLHRRLALRVVSL